MQTRKNKRNETFPLFHSCSHEKPRQELNQIHNELFMAVFIPTIRDQKHLLPRAFLRKKKGPFAAGISSELLPVPLGVRFLWAHKENKPGHHE
jgi:hypothetical protein